MRLSLPVPGLDLRRNIRTEVSLTKGPLILPKPSDNKDIQIVYFNESAHSKVNNETLKTSKS